jgi:hypothetical protein
MSDDFPAREKATTGPLANLAAQAKVALRQAPRLS